jgi:hypothetical protein
MAHYMSDAVFRYGDRGAPRAVERDDDRKPKRDPSGPAESRQSSGDGGYVDVVVLLGERREGE